jgi:hypothetical protein
MANIRREPAYISPLTNKDIKYLTKLTTSLVEVKLASPLDLQRCIMERLMKHSFLSIVEHL